MQGRTSMKLIIEKGPREGETLTYLSGSLIKVGRVVSGNTIGIKDPGISSKHMRIQFDNELSKWTLCDLDSSNGTFLNGQILKPYVPSALADGDRIKIGELTSIVMKIEVESAVPPRRNLRRQGKSGARAATDGANGKTELGLGFDGNLGENEVKEAVEKRNLRSRVRKNVDSRRILRSSKKEEVSLITALKQIPENLNVDVGEMVNVSVPVERKMTRGWRKKMQDQLPVDPGLDERKPASNVLPVGGRRTRGRRKAVEPLENAQSSGLEEHLNNANESLQIDEGNEATLDKLEVDPLEVKNSGLQENLNNANESLHIDEGNEAMLDKLGVGRLEKVKSSALRKNLDANNESAQEHVVEKLVSNQDVMADESSIKGKEVVEELECMKDGSGNCELDLEKMTLGDFFDYLEVQLPKGIYDESEKIISDLAEKVRKCHEFRLQRNEYGKGKLVTN